MREPVKPIDCLHLMALFDVNAPFCPDCGENMRNYWALRKIESQIGYGKGLASSDMPLMGDDLVTRKVQ